MRRLVAALACRVGGSRLYGKPMQLLDVEGGVAVLDHMIALLKTENAISEIVLGISEGPGNEVFKEVASRHQLRWIVGDQRDVLSRLIQCAELADGSDVFRVTTESPFTYFEPIRDVWRAHLDHGNDLTVIDGVPEGSHFEIYTLDSLRRSHERGDARHRSEYCSLYIRQHREEFKVEVVPVTPEASRLDLRLTIDNPEDLILCRAVYAEFKQFAPRIPLKRIIDFLDSAPHLRRLVERFVVAELLY
jgi:spore coat polysaccharide biosynthesis protein SpsF